MMLVTGSGIEGEVRIATSHEVQALTRSGWSLVAVTEEDAAEPARDQWGNPMYVTANGDGVVLTPTVTRRSLFVLARSREKAIEEEVTLTEAEITQANASIATLQKERAELKRFIVDQTKKVEGLESELNRASVAHTSQLKSVGDTWTARYDDHVTVLLKALTDQPDEERAALEALARLGNVPQTIDWLKARAVTRLKVQTREAE